MTAGIWDMRNISLNKTCINLLQEKSKMLTYKDVLRKQFNEAKQKSIEHHEEGVTCIDVDKSYRAEYYLNFNIYCDACALCGLFHSHDIGGICRKHKLCPLYDKEMRSCCKEWRLVEKAKIERDFDAFHEAEIALVARLKDIDYDVWLAGKRKGEKVSGENYKYTGEYRPPKKGEYYQFVFDRPLTAITEAPLDFVSDKCHIIRPIKLVKQEDKSVPQMTQKAMSVMLGTQAQQRIEQEILNSQDCRTCEHDYEPIGYRKSKKIESKIAIKSLYEAKNISSYAEYVGDFKFQIIATNTVPKKGDMYIFSNNVNVYISSDDMSYTSTIVDFATESERQRYYALKYTREIDSMKIRAYQKFDDTILICYKPIRGDVFETTNFNGLYTRLCKTANILIMPYSESHGDFEYPE